MPKSLSEVQFWKIYSSFKALGVNFSNQPYDSKAVRVFAASQTIGSVYTWLKAKLTFSKSFAIKPHFLQHSPVLKETGALLSEACVSGLFQPRKHGGVEGQSGVKVRKRKNWNSEQDDHSG